MISKIERSDSFQADRTEAQSANSYRGPLAYAISCFFFWGLAYGLLDVLNKHFQDTLHVGKAESAWLQIAYFGAYLLMSLPAGAVMQARGYKFGIVSGLVVTALGAFLFVPSAQVANFQAFVVSMFVLATGLCFLETAADTYVNVLGRPDDAARRLNLAQSFNGLGVLAGPLIGGSLFFSDATMRALGGEHRSVQVTYAVIGVLVLLFAAVLARANLPEVRDADHGPASDGEAKPLGQQRHFVFGVATQVLYIGAQVGIGAYFINLVTETWPGLSTQKGAFLLSAAMLAYLVGRFLGTALMSKVAPRTLLLCYAVINAGLTLVVAAGIPKISALALVAVFFFMSIMFATIFTLGVRDLGASTKQGAAMMVMAIGGGVLLPWPMGKIAELYGTPVAFLLPAACFVVVGLYAWKGAGTSVEARR
ncbi:sugar MFS transporter [Caulobacter sp. BK020]|uniref:sugar MFS transporter n=1 Tax=Caulobacter sp. BK020 TaxID=2512117 RepID=UPI0010F41576|nr:sugar MFS transporter [Caulobacter sp. BK020]TCS14926.1 FHS family L-fucose permease-like MFS transporter [Caulobacter sp. BK020]